MSTSVFFRRCGHRVAAALSSSPWRRYSSSTTDASTRIETPMLMLASPYKPESRFLYDVTLQKFTRRACLPFTRKHRLVGSSQGFVFASVDHQVDTYAINPLSEAQLPIPSTSSLPCLADLDLVRDSYGLITGDFVTSADDDPYPIRSLLFKAYRKAILSPSLNMAVVILCDRLGGGLAWARLGCGLDWACPGDTSWTAIPSPEKTRFYDAIFHKDLLYAVDRRGTLFAFDLDKGGPPAFVSDEGPLLDHDDSNRKMYLVESPDRESLFLLHCKLDIFGRMEFKRTRNFKVFKLNIKRSRQKKWRRVKSIGGNSALFVGLGDSMSLPVDGRLSDSHPKPDHIYFSGDDATILQMHLPFASFALGFNDTGVYSMKDGTVKRLSHSYDDLWYWDMPIWLIDPTSSS